MDWLDTEHILFAAAFVLITVAVLAEWLEPKSQAGREIQEARKARTAFPVKLKDKR